MCSSPDMIVRAAFVLGSALELQEEGRIAAGDSDGTDVLCRYDLVFFVVRWSLDASLCVCVCVCVCLCVSVSVSVSVMTAV